MSWPCNIRREMDAVVFGIKEAFNVCVLVYDKSMFSVFSHVARRERTAFSPVLSEYLLKKKKNRKIVHRLQQFGLTRCEGDGLLGKQKREEYGSVQRTHIVVSVNEYRPFRCIRRRLLVKEEITHLTMEDCAPKLESI